MNNSPYIHYKNGKKELINLYFIAIIPLILYGIYKNGILLYINDLINIKEVFIPIYFYFISIIIGLFVSLIYKDNKKENILLCLIVSLTISINTNMIIYPLVLFISLFISKYISNKTKLKINTISFMHILLLLSLLINSYSYMNISEKLAKFNYGMFDIFLGHGIGGVGSTSFISIIISLIILSFNKFYKKIIPITASLIYLIINLAYMFITNSSDHINIILNGTIYFSFVFAAADIYNTPNTKKGMFIYAIIIGILSSLFSFLFNIYEAGYISILLTSLLIPLINKIINKSFYKKEI